MGTTITPEILSRIQSEYKNKAKQNTSTNNNIFSNSNKNKYSKIFKNVYSCKKKNSLEEEEIIFKDNTNKLTSINSKNKSSEELFEKKIDFIMYRKHKSIDLSLNYYLYTHKKTFDNNILLNEKDFFELNKDENSEKDKDSINSDFIDISKKYLYFNKKKKKKIPCPNIHIQKSEMIRFSYYDKLITSNQWNPLEKEKTHNNLFFFDWDDTLLCTSYIAPTGALSDVEINRKDKDIIANLDVLVYKLLKKTLEKGKVFIITNAAPGWIEFSSKKLYPKSAELLSQIKIISARGLYEKRLPGDMRQWKTKAFHVAIDNIEINRNIPTNIVCFGDSIIEIEATYNIKDVFANAFIKTIKFKESPTLVELEKEIKVILSQFETILAAVKNLSIKVAKKKSE